MLQVLTKLLSDQKCKQLQTYNESIWKHCNGPYQLDKIPCKQFKASQDLKANRICHSVLFVQLHDRESSNPAKATLWH